MKQSMRIAIIGLGRMGRALAERWLEEGHQVSVWNRTSGRAGALQEHFLQHAVLYDCRARFMSAGIDQDFGAHRVVPRAFQYGIPASLSSSAVSNSGKPMTPEKLPRRSATKTAARPWMA